MVLAQFGDGRQHRRQTEVGLNCQRRIITRFSDGILVGVVAKTVGVVAITASVTLELRLKSAATATNG